MKRNFNEILLNQPLALEPSYATILNSRIEAGTIRSFLSKEHKDKYKMDEVEGMEEVEVDTSTKTGVVRIFDGLSAKGYWGTSYEWIANQVSDLIGRGTTTIVFYIDSPGGEVSGLFGLSNFIASLPTKYNVKTVAFTDGMATSAAYVLAAACQDVLATEASMLGSIGVIMTLVDVSKAEEAAGINYTILRSKSEKALANPHEETSGKVVSDAEKMLATLDNIMNTSVSSYRSKLTLDTIVGLKGSTVLAEEALSLGLIDRIVGSFDEALTISLTAPATQSNMTKGVTMSMTLEQALIKLNAAESELQTLKASSSLELAKAKQQEQGRVLGILEAATTFKLPSEMAVKRIKANASIEDAVEMFESIKEALQGATFVDTSATTLTHTTPATPAPAAQAPSFLEAFVSGIDKVVASESIYKGVK